MTRSGLGASWAVGWARQRVATATGRLFSHGAYPLTDTLSYPGDPGLFGPGSMFVAPRGHRHGFSNPHDEEALVLGIWAPPEPALAFMRDIGAALSPDTPPDPERMRDIYARHASRLLP